jgi:ACS family tartrate transporter-like MFS transporter
MSAPTLPQVTPEYAKATFAKISWRLMPFLVIAYILNFIDRVNLGFAALQMNTELGFSATVFGNGAGILFVGYFLFGVPSNMLLHKIGARRLIGTLLFFWGVVASAMAFVTSETSFYVIRFLLGLAEAGFFPGVILYLSYWYPKQRLGRITALFMFALPVSSMLGSVISGYLLSMDGIWGIAGWKWMFMLEGIPAAIFGIIGYFYLTDRPFLAAWLQKDQQEYVQGVLDYETEQARQSAPAVKQDSFLTAFMHPRVLMMAFTYFLCTTGVYGINLWLPQIIKSFGDIAVQSVGWISAIPYLLASVGMLVLGYTSDRLKERKWHVTFCAFLSGACISLTALTLDNLTMSIILISISSIGTYAILPIYWNIPPTFLTGATRAVGIGIINTVGNLGGLVAPIVIGRLRDATGAFTAPLIYLGLAAGVTMILVYIAAHKAKDNIV